MSERYDKVQAFKHWMENLIPDTRWGIMINADPDAIASAMALKRLLNTHVRTVDILRINEVSRPDNLAMIRYLRIPIKLWQADKIEYYNSFAMVDSQPTHNPAFEGLNYSLIIDHHPYTQLESFLAPNAFVDIRPYVGATSTILTQFLQAFRIRPGTLLATALLYGIRTDTGAFERSGGEEDLKAYQWLSRYADNNLLRRISHSEYLRSWLPFFSRAFRNLMDCRGGGSYAALNEVSCADLIVSIADFFTKVHGLKWIAVSGIVHKIVIVVFRGDGSRDLGRFADACFHDVGSAGGHRNMARAEFPLKNVPPDIKASEFVYRRLMTRKLRPRPQIESEVIPMPDDSCAPALENPDGDADE